MENKTKKENKKKLNVKKGNVQKHKRSIGWWAVEFNTVFEVNVFASNVNTAISKAVTRAKIMKKENQFINKVSVQEITCVKLN